MSLKRLLPEWNLPAYRFIPGKNPHPKKEGGHMYDLPEPVCPSIDMKNPDQSSFLRFALDLFNHGYFWESHVYFEALWNAHERRGSVADFFKGLIKLGAAGVKLSIDQEGSARGHFKRARELLLEVKEKEGALFLGFDLTQILTQIDHALENKLELFPVFPQWN